MMVNQLLEKSKIEFNNVSIAAKNRRVTIEDLSYEDFVPLLYLECKKFMFIRGIFREWVIDIDNAPTIKLLYQYLSGDINFKGSLDKGIFLMGSLGSGKTILLKGFVKVIEKLSDRFFKYVSAYNLSKLIIAEGTEKYSKMPMLIDDLGKENEVIKDYGTDCRPMVELFASRYDVGAITFVTTNYNMKTFAEKYGEQTVERWLEMFNFIELKTKSRRE